MAQRRAVRSVVATVLVVLGGIGLVVASTGWWLERSFLRTGNFTETANELLDQDDVQTELTALLVGRLSEEAGTDLQVAEPFLATIVTRVVESDPFRTVFDEALSRAHRVLVDRDTRRIVLNLTGAYDLVKGPLEQVAPDLADELPSRKELSVTLLQRSQLTAAWDVIDEVRRAVTLVAIAAVALLAVGIAIAPERLRAAARGAWAVVASAAVLVVAVLVTRFVVQRQIDDGVAADAVGASLRVITSPLLVQTCVVAALAALVAVAARYTERQGVAAWRRVATDTRDWARGIAPVGMGEIATTRAWHLPAPRVPSRSSYAARALALAALGLVAVFDPGAVGRVVIVLAGAAALVLAATEALAARRAPRRAEAEAKVR